MQERRNTANRYVNAIINDIQNQFVREETIIFSESKIVREYEFEDGAVIKYEWQSEVESIRGEQFNHRFTLANKPTPNPQEFELGVLKTLSYKG
ncbi:MAG: hypothetical protein AAB336_12875 [Acidobacteriota bacterium]